MESLKDITNVDSVIFLITKPLHIKSLSSRLIISMIARDSVADCQSHLQIDYDELAM